MRYLLLELYLEENVKTDLDYITGSSIRGAFLNLFIDKFNINEDIALNKEYREKLFSLEFFDGYKKIDDNLFLPSLNRYFANKHKFKTEVLRTESVHATKNKIKDKIYKSISIEKDQSFYSFVKCSDVNFVKETLQNENLYIGGYKSSGYGKVKVNVINDYSFEEVKDLLGIKSVENFDKQSTKINNEDNNQKTLTVYFASDSILKNEFGQSINYIEPKILEQKLNIQNVVYESGEVEIYEIKTYNSKLKTNIVNSGVKKGSILTYSYTGTLENIEKVESEGIGSNKECGFGRIFINPNIENSILSSEKNSNSQNNEYKYLSESKAICNDIKLTNEDKYLLDDIFKNINKERNEEKLNKIILESVDTKTDSFTKKKVNLSISSSQLSRLIALINECEKEVDDKKSMEILKTFRDNLKGKTKNDYSNKSKNSLFNYPLYIPNDKKNNNQDYFDVLMNSSSVDELTNTKFNYQRIGNEKTNNYREKLRLTKEILKYKLRRG